MDNDPPYTLPGFFWDAEKKKFFPNHLKKKEIAAPLRLKSISVPSSIPTPVPTFSALDNRLSRRSYLHYDLTRFWKNESHALHIENLPSPSIRAPFLRQFHNDVARETGTLLSSFDKLHIFNHDSHELHSLRFSECTSFTPLFSSPLLSSPLLFATNRKGQVLRISRFDNATLHEDLLLHFINDSVALKTDSVLLGGDGLALIDAEGRLLEGETTPEEILSLSTRCGQPINFWNAARREEVGIGEEREMEERRGQSAEERREQRSREEGSERTRQAERRGDERRGNARRGSVRGGDARRDWRGEERDTSRVIWPEKRGGEEGEIFTAGYRNKPYFGIFDVRKGINKEASKIYFPRKMKNSAVSDIHFTGRRDTEILTYSLDGTVSIFDVRNNIGPTSPVKNSCVQSIKVPADGTKRKILPFCIDQSLVVCISTAKEILLWDPMRNALRSCKDDDSLGRLVEYGSHFNILENSFGEKFICTLKEFSPPFLSPFSSRIAWSNIRI